MNIPAQGFSLFQIDVPDSECLETFRPVDPSSFTKRNVSRMLIGSLHFSAFGRTGLSMAEQGQTGRAGATGGGGAAPPPPVASRALLNRICRNAHLETKCHFMYILEVDERALVGQRAHGSLEGVGGLKTNEAYHSKADALVIPEM